MSEKTWEIILAIVLKTTEVFNLKLDLFLTTKQESAVLYQLNNHGKVVIKLTDEIALIFQTPILSDKIRAQLVCKKSKPSAADWQKILRSDLGAQADFSIHGFVSNFDQIFNLAQPEKESEPDGAQEANEVQEEPGYADERPLSSDEKQTQEIIDEEVVQKSKSESEAIFCPDCNQQMAETEDGHYHCENCDNDYCACPNCGHLEELFMGDDPPYSCAQCGKILLKIECPNCYEKILANSGQCPKCQSTFTTSKCPHCHKDLLVHSNLDECPFCQENIWVCPHCNQYLAEDPDDLQQCPECRRTLRKMTCPHCNEEIWSDTDKCPECGKKLQLDRCPHCHQQIFVSDQLEYCPHCDEPVWVCPRCQTYIDVDPEDSDSDNDGCPSCHKSFLQAACPNCEEEIWSDLEKCPKCGQELKPDLCPDCGFRIFLSSKVDECPSCGTNLWICPRCHMYINEDPTEVEECPRCDELLKTYDCPKCGQEGIFVTNKVCPRCQATLDFEDCPYCGKSIPSGLDGCPLCEESLEQLECPHCKKNHYIES